MFVTHEEASKKWCPLVRNLYDEGNSNQRVATSYNADRKHNKCISVNCMLWYPATSTTGCCGLVYKHDLTQA